MFLTSYPLGFSKVWILLNVIQDSIETVQLLLIERVNAVDGHLLAYEVTLAQGICYSQYVGDILGRYLFWSCQPILTY